MSINTRLASIALAWLLVTGTAHAGSLFFGESDTLHPLADVDFRGKQGERLFLAYRTSTRFILLGVNLSRHGYVLGIDGNPGAYYPLSAQQIARFQTLGKLPRPLPAYRSRWSDYMLGYSLWLAFGFAVLYYALRRALR